MTVEAASGVNSMYSTSGTARPPKNELDSKAFLQLLVTQLQNQDPSSPMDSNDLMAQQTQLASMEQLTEIAGLTTESFALQMRMGAAGLINQNVTWVAADGASQSGTVSAVSYATSPPTVTVGDQQIPLDAIAAVTAAPRS